MIHDPDVASLTIDTGNGTNLINLLDVPAPGLTAAAQTIAVNTGTGTDQVSVYAGQSNHTYNVNLGQSTGNTGTGDVLVLDGDPTKDGNDTFTVVLGGANDTAQVAGADLFPRTPCISTAARASTRCSTMRPETRSTPARP